MNKQVQKYVELCKECQMNKPKIKTVEPIVVTDTPQHPFDNVSIDTIGPLKIAENGNKYALTMMCDLSKYLVTAPIANKEANTVAKAMFESLISIHGPIKILLSGQGTEFVNSVMKNICDDLKIQHKTSTAYHHETLGSVERNHRVFNEYLRSYLFAKECNSVIHCRKCAENHNVLVCFVTSENFKCINCILSNKNSGTCFNSKHVATDSRCPCRDLQIDAPKIFQIKNNSKN